MCANSDTHAQRIHVLQEDAISITSIDALFKQLQQIKGTVYRSQNYIAMVDGYVAEVFPGYNVVYTVYSVCTVMYDV